ncbi:hypothetical protein FRC02_009188 [Tulasnella sp. 418]|nr:hypothetical protein FRC02_009188 [Tulasnella sp. 418]
MITDLGLVSTRWHQIIHNTGSLWSMLDLSLGINIIQALIQKSGSAPLTVIAAGGDMDEDMEGMICAEMYRTKHMILSDPRVTTTRREGRLNPRSAPLLEELIVKGTHGWMRRITQFQLLEEVLEGHVPRLCRLIIEGTTIPARALPSSPLTHLTAIIRHKDIDSPQFARKMCSYTNLVELRLTGYGPNDPANQAIPGLRFALPHLRYLRLHQVGGRETLFLLSTIKEFKNVSIYIDWMHIPRFTSLLPTFKPFPIFDSALGRSLARSLRELTIIESSDHDDAGRAEVQGWRGSETAGIGIPDLFLTLRPWLLTDVASNLLSSLDGSRLTKLDIGSTRLIEMVASLLPSVASLEQLGIRDCDHISPILDKLELMACPNLRILEISPYDDDPQRLTDILYTRYGINLPDSHPSSALPVPLEQLQVQPSDASHRAHLDSWIELIDELIIFMREDAFNITGI